MSTQRPRYCPWVTRPSHGKNGRLVVDKWTPVVQGYCPVIGDCASCAGTGFKPNIVLNVGRPQDSVACPYCTPDRYKKELEKLGKWKPAPPPPPPAKPKTEEEEDEDWEW